MKQLEKETEHAEPLKPKASRIVYTSRCVQPTS